MVALSIAVDCTAPVWICIGEHDGIRLIDGRADILAPRGTHALAWAVHGREGERFSAVIRKDGREVCVVDGWAAPYAPHRDWVGHFVKFEA